MPEFNATKAAKLYGKSRMTIWRYVTSGKLSSRIGDDGQRLIDLSELIRVFGEPNRPVTSVTVTPQTSDTAGGYSLQQEMLAELKALRQEVRELREALIRIEHKPEPAPPKPVAVTPIPTKTKASSFADLLDSLDD